MKLKKENEVLKKELVDNKEGRIFQKRKRMKKLLKDDLNKKTINELKELLNTEDFLPFKEEWKGLTKKEDIINFILTKGRGKLRLFFISIYIPQIAHTFISVCYLPFLISL